MNVVLAAFACSGTGVAGAADRFWLVELIDVAAPAAAGRAAPRKTHSNRTVPHAPILIFIFSSGIQPLELPHRILGFQIKSLGDTL